MCVIFDHSRNTRFQDDVLCAWLWFIVAVVFNATDFSYGIPTVLLQVCCVEEACCYGFLRAAARAGISKVSMPGSLDTGLVCNNPEVSAQVSTLVSQDVIVAYSTLLILS